MGAIGIGVIGVVIVLSSIAGFFFSLFYLIIPSSRGLLEEKRKRWNITEKRYNEIYDTWENPCASRTKFFHLVVQEHKELIENSDFENIELEETLQFVIYKLQNYSKNSELKKLLELWFHTNQCDERLRDFCVGGGWLPPHHRPAHISPTPLSAYNGQTVSKDLPFDLFMFYALTKSEEYGYTFDIAQHCCFNLILSPSDSLTPTQMEHFWTSLQSLNHPVSFEMIGDGTRHAVIFQLLCHADDKTHIYNQLTALFPDSSINPEGSDKDFFTEQVGDISEFLNNFDAHGISFGLGSHYSYPIRTWSSYDKTDPLGTFINLLSDLPQDEGAVIQVLVSPLKNWEDQSKRIRQVKERDKEDEFGFKKCPIDQKRRYPLFAVSLRSMSFCKKETGQYVSHSFSESFEKALQAFRLADGNSITSQPAELLETKAPRYMKTYHSATDSDGNEYTEVKLVTLHIPELYATIPSQLSKRELVSIFTRNTYRHGFILNTQELASLCHFPHPALKHPKLLRQDSAFVKAPEHLTTGQGLFIGINEVFGQSQEVYVPEDFRFRHMYVVPRFRPNGTKSAPRKNSLNPYYHWALTIQKVPLSIKTF